jgi:competence protein ComEC
LQEPKLPRPPDAIRLGARADNVFIVDLPAVQLATVMSLGVAGSRICGGGIAVWLLLFGSATLVAMRIRSPRNWLIASWVCVFAAMVVWGKVHQSNPTADDLYQLANDQWQPVVLKAVVSSSPELRPNSLANSRVDESPYQSVFELQIVEYRSSQRWIPATGGSHCVVKGDVTNLIIGDRILLHAHVRRIGAPTNPGTSDMRSVYAARGIYSRIQVDDANQISIAGNPRWSLWRVLSWIGKYGDKAIQKYVGGSSGPLVSALVLGRRQAVDPEIRDQLLETGTIHMLSVSGLHLAMVAKAMTLLLMLTTWPRGWQITVVLVVCLFYAGLTGANPPVLRASLLVATMLIGTWAGKQPNPLNSLAIAAVILLLLNPDHLLQTGTQLSFLAVATLVLFGHSFANALADDAPLENLIRSVQPRWIRWGKDLGMYLRQFSIVSFWVWIVSAPLVWHSYHIVSPISVLANLLLMVPLTLATLLGLATAFIGMIAGPAAIPVGWLCHVCIQSVQSIVGFCSLIPLGHVWFPAPPSTWVFTFYLIMIGTLFVPNRWLPRPSLRGKCVLAWIMLWFIVALFLATGETRTKPHSHTQLTFIDVGHGTSVLIELPDDRGTWLYDAGRLGDPQWSVHPIQDVLWSRGIWHLDGLIISHADADHYNAAPDLLHRFTIDRIVTPPDLISDTQLGLADLQQRVAQLHSPVIEAYAGLSLKDLQGKPWARILHPPQQRLQASDNANSLVLELVIGNTTVLLPGDLEMPGTDIMLATQRPLQRPLSGGLLMAPHHGSTSQDPLPILQWMRPKHVVVSGGPRANRPEVIQRLSETGAAVYSTAAFGAIQIATDGSGHATIQHWDTDHWADLP